MLGIGPLRFRLSYQCILGRKVRRREPLGLFTGITCLRPIDAANRLPAPLQRDPQLEACGFEGAAFDQVGIGGNRRRHADEEA
jgi:hypothetical protein